VEEMGRVECLEAGYIGQGAGEASQAGNHVLGPLWQRRAENIPRLVRVSPARRKVCNDPV
jgi:hypothetical protein